MAKPIKEGWEMEITTVEDSCEHNRYLRKNFIHTSSGCQFSEQEYEKRTQED